MAEESQLNVGIHWSSTSGGSRWGQRLFINNRLVSKLRFYVHRTGSPGGTLTFAIRRVSDDGLLATKDWGPSNNIATDPAWYEVTFDSPVLIDEEVRIYHSGSAGSAGNLIGTYNTLTDVKGGEFKTRMDEDPPWIDDEDKDVPYVYTYTPAIVAPTVTTNPATEVEEETATGNGNITDNGGEDCDKRGICWNTTGNPTVADNKSEETDPFGTGAFSRPITGLSPGTKYYVKAYAHNSAGYGYGGEESFTTKPNAPSNLMCVVQSSSQIDINWTKGTGATKTMVRRKVGSYPSDITDGDQAYYGTGNSFSDTSLVRATHYYYRAWSWVEGSDIWSDDYAEDNAWTLIGAPAVTTNAATGLSAISATLNGTLVDDGGEACECGFEWGLDTDYGTTTPPQSKTTGETFSQVIGGLVTNTTYHFRAFATNSLGTGYGADRTFTTALIISRAFALAREEL